MNESTSRLVTTHRARAPSSRPLSPFHRARRASRDRIDDRGTESTTEGLNRRLRARITRNAMISTRNASNVPRTRSRRSKRSFVHVIARSSRSSRSVAVSRARRHSFHSRACTHARRARGGDTRRVTTHQYHFSCLFPPQTGKKKIKKSKSTRDAHGGGYTRVMTQ